MSTKSNSEGELKADICEVGKRLYERRYVAAQEGNLSIRLSENEILGGPAFPPGGRKSVKTTIATASDRTMPAHRSMLILQPDFSRSPESVVFLRALATFCPSAKRVRSDLMPGRTDTLGLRLVCRTDHADIAFPQSQSLLQLLCISKELRTGQLLP